MNYILGLSAFYHDSAAVLLRDGEIVCAFQEERFTRVKHDNRFPAHAIQACLDFGQIKLNAVDTVAYYEDPALKFNRIIKTYFKNFPKGIFSFIQNYKRYAYYKNIKGILQEGFSKYDPPFAGQFFFSEHHLSHAASAFYTSPFNEAAVLCIDGGRGMGDGICLAWSSGKVDAVMAN